MPPEIVALVDKPILLAALLAVGAACGLAVAKVEERMRRARGRAYWQARRERETSGNSRNVVGFRKPFKAVPLRGTPERGITDAADQLRIVMEADFEPRPLLNKPERRVFVHLERILAEEAPGWRAMGQVSLGEILASKDGEAYSAINSKRVDILIVDTECRPKHAVEFQGTGHHLSGQTAARDAVKKEALRRAGIGYVEVVSGDTPAELKQIVRKLVGRA